MSDASVRTAGAGLDRVRADLASQGYALTNDEEIGLPEKFRENFAQKYFNDKTLHRYEGDRPRDRKRARDVVRYQWGDDGLHLDEHETITIMDRGGMPGRRDHMRVMFLKDPQAKKMISTFLGLVPLKRREPDGTFGINLFRTFKDVVTTPHSDEEQFCIFYIIDRLGDGAETYLYRPDDVTEQGEPIAEPVLRRQLNPGEIIIFEDKLFKHGATALEAPAGVTTMRDAVVCTVDYRETYLGASAAS
jgi:hypothetical protein